MPELFLPTEDNKVAERIYKTTIDGLYYIAHATYTDERGFFSELAQIPELEQVTGQKFIVKQINQTQSVKNVARGIHAEDWNKYVTVIMGKSLIVIVDVRPESKTFGKKEYFILGFGSDALDGSLYIPAGAGNSFFVLEDPFNYVYFVDKLYKDRDPKGDLAISLFDKDLAIAWPVPSEQMIISDRDKDSVMLREKYPEKF